MQYWELLGKTGYQPPRPYFFTPVAFFLFLHLVKVTSMDL